MLSNYLKKFNLRYIHENTEIPIGTLKNWKYKNNINNQINFLIFLNFLRNEINIDLNILIPELIKEHKKKKE